MSSQEPVLFMATWSYQIILPTGKGPEGEELHLALLVNMLRREIPSLSHAALVSPFNTISEEESLQLGS